MDPMSYARCRQVGWILAAANDTGRMGEVHRLVGMETDGWWREPSVAAQAALKWLGWQVRRNLGCRRGVDWPQMEGEPTYEGTIHLRPAFTDGSVGAVGGAAAVRMEDEEVRSAWILQARSSTHCELVGLVLAMWLQPTEVITESLTALRLLQTWGTAEMPARRMVEHSD